MQRGGAFDAGGFLQLAAQFPIGWRAAEQAAEERFQVQCGAADEENFLAPRGDFAGGSRGGLEVLCHAELFGRIKDVDQMMWDETSLVGGRLGGTDVHAAI